MHTQRVCMNAHTKCVYEYAYKDDITSLDAPSEQQGHAVAPSSQHTLCPLSLLFLSLSFSLSFLLSRSSLAPVCGVTGERHARQTRPLYYLVLQAWPV